MSIPQRIEQFFDCVYENVIYIACADKIPDDAAAEQLTRRAHLADHYASHALKTLGLSALGVVTLFPYAISMESEVALFGLAISSAMMLLQTGIAVRNTNFSQSLKDRAASLAPEIEII